MTRYADPERCPDCLAAMPFGASRCPSCGLNLEGALAAKLFATLSSADDLLTRMRAAAAKPTAAPTSPPAMPPANAGSPARAAATAPPAGGVGTLVRPEATRAVGVPAGGPPLPPAHHGGLSGASVPKILLGLGALCLLVAALVFLAVTWSAMGVAGRTATLLGFTVIAGGLSAWAARRDLRAACESLGVVALGLLTFDMFGARNAGWLGDIDVDGFFVLLGVVLALAGTAASTAVRRTPVRAFAGGEVVAALGIGSAAAGFVAAEWLAWSPALTVVVALTALAALGAQAARLTVLSVGTATVSLMTWALLATSAWDRAAAHPSLRELWLDLEVWPLLVAAALVGALALVTALPLAVRLTSLSVAVLLVAGVALAPFVDETTTEATAAGGVLLLVVSAATWYAPKPWRRSLGAPVGLGLVAVLTAWVLLAAEGLQRIAEVGDAAWSGQVGDSFPTRFVDQWEMAAWLLPVLMVAASAALIAVARSFMWADRLVAPLLDLDLVIAVAALTAALTMALYPVPVWSVTALLLGTAIGFVVVSLGRQQALPLVIAAAFLSLALILALHAEWLMLATLAVVLGSALAVHLRWRALEVSVGAGALVAGATAGLVWTVGALFDASEQWTAVAALVVLAALVLGGPYVDTRIRLSGPATYARVGTEVAALVSAGIASLAAVDLAGASQATWSAVYLTLTGAVASAMALLRPDRRLVGWLGGFLLVVASWVRLWDLGVDTPEAYTLPSAVALLVVGSVRLSRDRRAGTMASLAPGLALGLLPSLLWVLADPIALRSLLLGIACLLLVLVGVRLHWSAPVVLGAVVGALLVVRLAIPVVEPVPRWALIGAAGILLVAVGITWEKRVRDARRIAGYVRSLR